MKLQVVLATVPMMGHLTPLIPYAEELLRRGHDVTFVHQADPKYRRKLEQSGLLACQSVTYQDTTEMYDCIKNNYSTVGKPSVIVYDFFAIDAADAADFLNIPAISVFPNLAVTVNPWASPNQDTWKWALWCRTVIPIMESIIARVLWVKRSYTRWSRNLPILPEQDVYPSKYQPRSPVIGCTSPHLEFNSFAELPEDMFAMVGPALPTIVDPISQDLKEWLDDQKSQQRSIVYVAFGSMFKHTSRSVQKLQGELLMHGGDKVSIVWSLPKKDQKALKGAIPPHWRIEAHFPQVALFRTNQIDAFVTHCGSNSVYEALLNSIPMVCCPGFADQPGNAVRLVRAGVAVIASDRGVGAALDDLLDNFDYMKLKAVKLAGLLRQLGGAAKAVSVMEDVADRFNADDCKVGQVTSRRVPWWPFSLAAVCGFMFMAIF